MSHPILGRNYDAAIRLNRHRSNVKSGSSDCLDSPADVGLFEGRSCHTRKYSVRTAVKRNLRRSGAADGGLSSLRQGNKQFAADLIWALIGGLYLHSEAQELQPSGGCSVQRQKRCAPESTVTI